MKWQRSRHLPPILPSLPHSKRAASAASRGIARSNLAPMDIAEQLLDAWRINCRINHELLGALDETQFRAPLAKGKAVSGQFGHMHNVRRMWLRAIDPVIGDALAKLERGEHSRDEIDKALAASDAAA